MKNLFILAITIFCISAGTHAQEVNKDSLQSLKDEKKNIEITKSINDKKMELAKNQNHLAEKNKEVEKTAADAQKAADDNKVLAARLGKDPQNKQLASDASKAARQAERSAKKARNAADDQQKLTKDITSLESKIAEDEAKLGAQASVANKNSQPVAAMQSAAIQPAAKDTAQNITPVAPVQPAAKGAVQNITPAAPAQPAMENARMLPPQVITQNIHVDSLRSVQNAQGIAQKVVESTYKNYPQQSGQPSIIINNIIIPSDYERPKLATPAQNPEMAQMSAREREDYEDYKAWKRQRNADNNSKGDARRFTENSEQNINHEPQPMASKDGKLTFKERFGERAPRNSGLWVIPVVGVHASSFKADFSGGKADGRIGWNAGLDFRIHEKRFFIQPGVHYFNSSMRISTEDSLSNAPLLSGPRLHSLKVPLLLGLYLTRANKGFFKMNVKAGATGTYVLAVDKSDIKQFDRDNIEDFSYGLNAGLGLEFGLISLDISHEWGMSTLFKDSNNKNNVFRATIGLKL